MKMQRSRSLLPVLAALLIATALALAGAGASLADKGGCPNETSGNGGGHANDNSAHGPKKQDDRDCHPGPSGSQSTPTEAAIPVADPTPAPTTEPTASPTPTPIPTPPPGADVQTVEVIVNSPAGAGTGVQFVLTGGANIRNNGPVTPAIVDTTLSPALPPGCAATTGVMTVQNTTLPANINVFVSRSWMVTCAEGGFFTITIKLKNGIQARP